MDELEQLRERLRIAAAVLDDARAASNKYLIEKRTAEEQLAVYRRALAFARSVIKSGEPWTETCENIIGGLLT